jgi:hypothetical protein
MNTPEAVLYEFGNPLYEVYVNYIYKGSWERMLMITLPSLEQARYYQLNCITIDSESLEYVTIEPLEQDAFTLVKTPLILVNEYEFDLEKEQVTCLLENVAIHPNQLNSEEGLYYARNAEEALVKLKEYKEKSNG